MVTILKILKSKKKETILLVRLRWRAQFPKYVNHMVIGYSRLWAAVCWEAFYVTMLKTAAREPLQQNDGKSCSYLLTYFSSEQANLWQQ